MQTPTTFPDATTLDYMEGYKVGEMERIALATANSELRSTLFEANRNHNDVVASIDQLVVETTEHADRMRAALHAWLCGGADEDDDLVLTTEKIIDDYDNFIAEA